MEPLEPSGGSARIGRIVLPLSLAAAALVIWLVIRTPAPAPQSAVSETPAAQQTPAAPEAPPAAPAAPVSPAAVEPPPAIPSTPPAVAAVEPAQEPVTPDAAAPEPAPETPIAATEPAPPAPDPTPVIPEPVPTAPDDGLVEVVHDEAPPAPPTPPAATAPTAGSQAAEPAAAPRYHTVVKGDTLGRIARKYGVSQREIMQANRMRNDIVQLGRKLVIPAAR